MKSSIDNSEKKLEIFDKVKNEVGDFCSGRVSTCFGGHMNTDEILINSISIFSILTSEFTKKLYDNDKLKFNKKE